MPGQRDFAAAVLLPHAAACAAAVLRQSAAVELATHVELLGITVLEYFRYSGSLRQYGGNKTHANILQRQSAELGSGKIGTLQRHLAVLQRQYAVCCGSPAALGSGSLAAVQLVFSGNVVAPPL
ncbi:hypothetical protein DFH08DRAFT_825347 [Mycena albidolilacea]|uniref:Uncharacterized protein n=1 Tax=Mycena albidolilacea TaxID=1033008 RepID=A0AAD7EA60_9AGAR|nr:hypothetical protein DFH08DRAFT_825347 [Mycena albidolilacea]